MYLKYLYAILLSLAVFTQASAQYLDTLQLIKKIDSTVRMIDNKKDMIEFISEGQVMRKRTQKLLNDGFAEYYYHDGKSRALLKVFYNPTRKEAFSSTYYASNDSLISVKTVSRKRYININWYYFSNNNLIKVIRHPPYTDPNYFIQQWERLFAKHLKYCK